MSRPVPIVMLPLTLAAVHYHPEPVDDCPCFEDAIAVLAVILGICTGHWHWARQPLPPAAFERRYLDEGMVKASLVGVMRIVVGASTFPWTRTRTWHRYRRIQLLWTQPGEIISCIQADCRDLRHLPLATHSESDTPSHPPTDLPHYKQDIRRRAPSSEILHSCYVCYPLSPFLEILSQS